MMKEIDAEILERLRQPTPAMIRAGREVVDADPFWIRMSYDHLAAALADVFAAMVEEALRDPMDERAPQAPVSMRPSLYHRPPS